MSYIERFRQAWANRRRDPFGDQDLAIDKAEDGLSIPSATPYVIQLVEVPRKDVPSTITVYNVSDSVWMTEVTGAPGQNEFRVDYPSPDGEGTGLVEFSSLDAGKTVNIAYKATGSAVITEFLDTLMSHPVGETAGDLYYFDGSDIVRLADALNIITTKLTATALSPVDVGSSDSAKDKAISNALAKAWQDHILTAHIDVERIIGIAAHNYNLEQRETQSGTPVKLKEIRINEDTKGSLKVEWQFIAFPDNYQVRSQLYINGAPVEPVFENAPNEFPTICSVELHQDLVDGDLIQIYGWVVDAEKCYVQDMELWYSWGIKKLMGIELADAITTTQTTQISTTNQDPV